MKSVVVSSPLVLLAALVVKGVGGGTNQPNVITQSVTWSSAKKGPKTLSMIEGSCPTDDVVVETSPRSVKLLGGSQRYSQSDYADTESDLDIKLKRLVRLLDNMQKREGTCEWGTCSKPRKTQRRNYWRRKDDFDYEDYQDSCDYTSLEEEFSKSKKNRRPRYQRVSDDEIEDQLKRVKTVPKSDWLVLRKSHKRNPRRWTKEEEECDCDSEEGESTRDVLYIPRGEPREKCRKRIVNDYTR